MNEETTHRKHLRWRCRRGMRELDQLLVRYLDAAWPTADATEQVAFERLLATEDDALWRWCMGRERPAEKELDDLVQRIVALPH